MKSFYEGKHIDSKKRVNLLVQINEFEKSFILERMPQTHIVRTMKKDSGRHHYYCEESVLVMSLLNQLRGGTSNSKSWYTT